jgi:hypothetical protein
MSDLVQNKKTTMKHDEVIMKSVQFFTTGRWRTQSQSERIATFVGTPPIPFGLLLLTIVGFALCVIPGIIIYIMAIKKIRTLQNIVITANPVEGGSEVIIKYSKPAEKLVADFVATLP